MVQIHLMASQGTRQSLCSKGFNPAKAEWGGKGKARQGPVWVCCALGPAGGVFVKAAAAPALLCAVPSALPLSS